MVAAIGVPAPVGPLRDALAILRLVGGIGLFFVAGFTALIPLRAVAQRLSEGRFDWPNMRLLSRMIPVQITLIVLAFAVLMLVQLAMQPLLGGWASGWFSAMIGVSSER